MVTRTTKFESWKRAPFPCRRDRWSCLKPGKAGSMPHPSWQTWKWIWACKWLKTWLRRGPTIALKIQLSSHWYPHALTSTCGIVLIIVLPREERSFHKYVPSDEGRFGLPFEIMIDIMFFPGREKPSLSFVSFCNGCQTYQISNIIDTQVSKLPMAS